MFAVAALDGMASMSPRPCRRCIFVYEDRIDTMLDNSGIVMHTDIQNRCNNAASNAECEMYDVEESKSTL